LKGISVGKKTVLLWIIQVIKCCYLFSK
jgi:hypothetical protein